MSDIDLDALLGGDPEPEHAPVTAEWLDEPRAPGEGKRFEPGAEREVRWPQFMGEDLPESTSRAIDVWTVGEALEAMATAGWTIQRCAIRLNVSYPTLYRVLTTTYARQLAVARKMAAEALITQAEDDLSPPFDGVALLPHQVTLLAKRANQRTWRAGKMDAAYSDSVTVRGDADAPLQTHTTVALTATEAYQRMLNGAPQS